MIDVVVVAYRSEAVLRDCINSLQRDPSCGTVYVVDNSPEFSLGIEQASGVVVLSSGRNLGFGAGVNFASGLLRTEFVAIVNPDTVLVDPNTITKCVRYMSVNPQVALLSPRVYVDGQLFRSSEHEPSLPRYLAYPIGLGTRHGVEKPLSKHFESHGTEALNGAFLVARRADLDSVGWFDERIFLFGEETDLCRRLRREGRQVHYLADGAVAHLDGHSTDAADFDVDRLRREARVEQLRRHQGNYQSMAYALLLSLASARTRLMARLPSRGP